MNEEAFFAELFESEPAPPAEPFVSAVMQRVKRRERVRRAVLAAAVAAGAAMSFNGIVELASLAGRVLVPLTSGWESALRLGAESWPVLALTLVALSWPAVVRWLAK